jgi:uncharacterized protein
MVFTECYHRSIMSQAFPELVDPRRCADLGKHFAGRIPLEAFSRLAPLLVDVAADAEFELEFQREGRRAVIRGKVRADLRLECQRCREPMAFTAASDICLAVVEGLDEIERLPEPYDPLMMEAPKLKLMDLLEDELLLSLPQVPMHHPGECTSAQMRDPVEATATEENPFAVLAELKRK